jgi:hypothetical protein
MVQPVAARISCADRRIARQFAAGLAGADAGDLRIVVRNEKYAEAISRRLIAQPRAPAAAPPDRATLSR